ncbi:MAG: hypothetical protein ACK4MV_14050 [Beijerinckiaceae bacterium]
MIFALGFLFAGLLTLMFLPAIWRRAIRLSQRRLEQRLPVSMAEVAAERDQLRAEFAIERRRIEQANEALVETRAKDLSELSRRGARIAALQGEVESLGARVSALSASLAEAEHRAAHAEGVWSALEKEVLDSTALSQRRMEDSAALQRGLLAASDLAETRRAELAGLGTQVEALRAERDDLRRDLAQAQLQLAEKASAAELFAKERDFTRSALAAANQRREALQKEVEDLNARLAEREQDLREAQRARARMSNEIADQTRAIEAGKATEVTLRAQSDAAQEAQREEARRNAERLQAARAERDALEGALDAARREARSLRDELAAARHAVAGEALRAGDDDILRQAISDLGAEVLRLTKALERQAGDSDATPADRIQRLQKTAGRASSMA